MLIRIKKKLKQKVNFNPMSKKRYNLRTFFKILNFY